MAKERKRPAPICRRETSDVEALFHEQECTDSRRNWDGLGLSRSSRLVLCYSIQSCVGCNVKILTRLQKNWEGSVPVEIFVLMAPGPARRRGRQKRPRSVCRSNRAATNRGGGDSAQESAGPLNAPASGHWRLERTVGSFTRAHEIDAINAPKRIIKFLDADGDTSPEPRRGDAAVAQLCEQCSLAIGAQINNLYAKPCRHPKFGLRSAKDKPLSAWKTQLHCVLFSYSMYIQNACGM